MDSALHFFVLVFSCSILTSQTINWDARSLSSPIITRSHRWLKGSVFKSFHAGSLVSCGLQCQRRPRCISSNFRKIVSFGEIQGGVCELNERGVPSPIEGNEDLEYEEESVYIQFYETNYDCQLTGCLNGGSCRFTEALKAFSCLCKEDWCGKYCEDINYCARSPCVNGGSCRNLADSYNCSCIEGKYIGKHCEQACPVPLGMESGAILDSQISASSEWRSDHAAQQARLNFQQGGGKTGSWSSLVNDDNQWLQVDLKNTTRVTRIATQGRNGYSQWVTKYKIQYRNDGQPFTAYRQNGDPSDTIFPGNTDRDTAVYHQLNPIIEGRYIRVLPVKWYGHISMRIELYTC